MKNSTKSSYSYTGVDSGVESATTGMTTVYGPTDYTLPGTGYIGFDFTNNFIWDGTSNIIISICYDNSGTSFNTSSIACFNSGVDEPIIADDSESGCSMSLGGTSTDGSYVSEYVPNKLD